jgi:hypothetical protein
MISAANSAPSRKALPVGARAPDKGRMNPILISFAGAAWGATTNASARDATNSIDHLLCIILSTSLQILKNLFINDHSKTFLYHLPLPLGKYSLNTNGPR